MLAELGPFDPIDVPDLRVFLEAVPNPRSRRGRWYSPASILLVCAAAAARPGEEHVSEGAAFLRMCRRGASWKRFCLVPGYSTSEALFMSAV
ncbi:hypothetical protein ACFYZJ_37045 [Streptomyces sp. NPDC001848]|uniref:hypothetical protein n=1 Tax=Streptomyces sp. NPDC001848 TaxID=3364618 RepID=UPI0036CED0F1